MRQRIEYCLDRLGERGCIALYWVILTVSVALMVAVHATIGL
ncbi:MAG: hypothetical protein AB1696_23425 [Planctomycetota bacterium]